VGKNEELFAEVVKEIKEMAKGTTILAEICIILNTL